MSTQKTSKGREYFDLEENVLVLYIMYYLITIKLAYKLVILPVMRDNTGDNAI